jgi:hypothetical protein
MLLPLNSGGSAGGGGEVQIDLIDGVSASAEVNIGNYINNQIPDFVAIDHPSFVDFMNAYYDWMSTEGNPKYESFNLPNTKDIDDTSDEFVENFRAQFLSNFPKGLTMESGADVRKIVKSIKDFYKAKGTEKSYKLLFRILFNEDPEFYYPKADILKLSDGKWRQPTILKVTRSNTNTNILDMVGKQVVQNKIQDGTTESYGYVESILLYEKEGYSVAELELSGVYGDFRSEADVECVVDAGVITEYVYPTLSEITVFSGGTGYEITDAVTVSGGLGVGSKAKITDIGTEGDIKSIRLTDSGINYKKSDTITISISSSRGSGISAGVTGGVALDSREGYYDNNNGLLGSNKKLQDNNYYQDFVYVVKSSKKLDDYLDIVKKIIHPAGVAIFGDTLLKETLNLKNTYVESVRKYEVPLIGHYTPYRFQTERNLRNNGDGGCGGAVDQYPNGYGFSAAASGTYDIEGTSAIHNPWEAGGVSGPLGGVTHGVNTNTLNTPQGAQFICTGGSLGGSTIFPSGSTYAHWIVYPHANSRGLTNIPWSDIGTDQQVLIVNDGWTSDEYVIQKTPYTQNVVGIVRGIVELGGGNVTLTINKLSGHFLTGSGDVIGGTIGKLSGVSSGASGYINTISNTDYTEGITKFAYVKAEDFLFNLERD